MTDNEIKKALEAWRESVVNGYEAHLAHGGKRDEREEDFIDLTWYALSLITRQKAEIERLKGIAANMAQRYLDKHKQYIEALSEVDEARAEAIKEFCEERGIEYVENDI